MTEKNQIIIVANTPEFRNQGVLWLQENSSKIENLASKNLWWRNHVKSVKVRLRVNPLTLMRDLAELGYKKTNRVLQPAEYSFVGGALSLWPINGRTPVRFDFSGNVIEAIEFLKKPGVKIKPEPLEDLIEHETHFKKGDYVVHQDHGIGRFKGTTDNLENYYEIEYARGDRLFLPFQQIKKISLYIGFTRPKVYGLGGSLWHRVKDKAKDDVIKLARDLLHLYAARQGDRGFLFIKNAPELKNLIEDFEYPETPDQTKAWREIERDMENPKPMDRILAGDVGFGKTELALRTAFKAVLTGKQAALIAPTTILANQHFDVFRERLERWGVNIGLLSRLQTAAENKKTIAGLKRGLVDIVIGTHRLLSGDVFFKDLGLLIIDEEQRFGVVQKEKIKKLKTNVDVLMLSATPIPRTLYLALAGLRPISKIETVPLGRQAIETHVEKFSWDAVGRAINEELKRNGQVFFLENRIHKMNDVIIELKKRFPLAKIEALHGRMSEKKIIEVTRAFKNGQIDILVATTIIENGLDLPQVNTLIVTDATYLGLAQAHQLRGRVGRRGQKAKAFFLYPLAKKHSGAGVWPNEDLTPLEHARLSALQLAKKHSGAGVWPNEDLTPLEHARLSALQEFAHLGAGFKLALRDLELRGAGNILGKAQTGHINQIGLNLYCEILAQAVEKLKT